VLTCLCMDSFKENFKELSGGGFEHEGSLAVGEALDASPARSVISLRGGVTPISPIAWLCSSTFLRVLVSVVSWWSSSVFVILLLKSVLQSGSVAGSFTLSSVTNAATGLLAWTLAHVFRRRSGIPFPELTWNEFATVLLIGLIQGIEIACGNKSLEFLSVSARTMIQSTGILFMMLTARIWGLERLGAMRLIVAALLTSGGVLQGFDHLSADSESESAAYVKGLLLQGVTLFLAAQRWSLLQWVTQRSQPGSALSQMAKLKLELISRTLPCTGVVCLGFAFFFEPGAFVIDPWLHADLALKSLGIAVGIVILTVAELEIVRAVSAVALQVLGTLHQIPIAVAGVLFLQEQIHLSSAVGFVLCVFGGLMYVQVRYSEMQTGYFSPPPSPQAFLETWPSGELAELGEQRLLQT